MGWLKELMSQAEPPVAGYGELARRTLEHPEWPDDTRPQPRSLAALYSKLDRGQELEWLAEREAVQRALALTLSCRLESIRRPLEALLDTPDLKRLRFEDLPFAKPFDFVEELLPPGIPSLVTRPSAWQRTWWLAPSGSGRSLAGRWLSARGLAVYVCARNWQEAAPRLPEAGATFVELERADDLPGFDELPQRPDVCIAAPVRPPAPSERSPGQRWQVLESPSTDSVLESLVDWVGARLPEDGAFDAAAARAWLEQPLRDGLLTSFGALLGACGLLDAQGVQASKGKALDELAAQYVHERLEQASGKGSAEAQWLKQSGFDVLVKLAEEVLTRGDQPWELARSQDEWIALIPNEFRESVDQEWIRWSLAKSGGQASTAELERALRSVPPGAYRIVRALADARVLRARGTQSGLEVAPAFLRQVALRRARQQLVRQASPFSWGEALLRPHAAAGILEAVDERLAEEEFILVESLFDLDLSSQPALVAAAEAVFVCLGLQVLSGTPVPRDYLTQIWNEQLSWVVELEGDAELPKPRLLCWEGSALASILSDPAVWSLAALAISERLGASQGARHPLLRPWGNELSSPKLQRLLDTVHACLLRPEIAQFEWSVRAFALIGRLYNSAPGKHDSANVHPLARPAFAVRGFLADRQTLAVEALGAHALVARALRFEGEQRATEWSQLAEAAWRDWRRRGCPPAADDWFAPHSPCHGQLWPHLPHDTLDAVWSRWGDQAWPVHCFGPTQWSAFVERWPRQFARHPSSPIWAQALERMDAAALEGVLREGQLWSTPFGKTSQLTAIVWRRAPEAMRAQLLERIEAHDAGGLARCLEAAPEKLHAELLPALTAALEKRTVRRQVLDEARRWLVRRVETRAPNWREAYTLLAVVEERVARSIRARGSLSPGG
jgi:hypothetical protein